jgi:hypothetical protein
MDDRIQVPVFNIVDDGETKQEDLRKVIAEVVGVKSGFHGSIISGFAKYVLEESVAKLLGTDVLGGQDEHAGCTGGCEREGESITRCLVVLS